MKDELVVPAFLAAAAIVVAFCSHTQVDSMSVRGDAVIERPVVNIPFKLRQRNWVGRGGPADGSCVHATIVSLLRWQGQYPLADRWRRNHSGGEVTWTTADQLDSEGVRYAWTQGGDVEFLEWAIRTRRGCGIQIQNSPNSRSYHMVALVDLTENYAVVLDNNDVGRFKYIKKDQLIANWQNSMGWAFTPVYSPAAPLPSQSARKAKL